MQAKTKQNPTNPHTLSSIQIQALDLLLQGLTITETACQLGINRCTIHEWSRNNQAFIAAFHAARQRHQDDVLDRYHALASPALQLLEGILTNQDAPDSIRLRAAQAVLRVARPPKVQPSAASRQMARFDQLCIEIAPHQALQRLAASQPTG